MSKEVCGRLEEKCPLCQCFLSTEEVYPCLQWRRALWGLNSGLTHFFTLTGQTDKVGV